MQLPYLFLCSLKEFFSKPLAICLLQGLEIKTAYNQGIENIKQIYSQEKYGAELHHFPKILNGEIQNISIAILNRLQQIKK